jgi:hypothetical protein
MTITTEELHAMAEGRHVFSHKDGLALAAEVLEWRKGQPYLYIGVDGKPVLARDMEDELLASRAKLDAARRLAGEVRDAIETLKEQDYDEECDFAESESFCGTRCENFGCVKFKIELAMGALSAWDATQ